MTRPKSVYATKSRSNYFCECPHCGHSLLVTKTLEGDLRAYGRHFRQDTDWLNNFQAWSQKLTISPISDTAVQEIEADNGKWMNHPEVIEASKNG